MRIAIIEDEPLAADRLRAIALAYPREAIQIVGETDSIAQAIELIPTWHTDLLLCDIRLADGLSFNIWQHTKVNCPTIFTTAYEEYALQAFKVNSIDYLLKPIQAEELYAALDRFGASRLQSSRQDNATLTTLSPQLIEQLTAAIHKPTYRQRLMSKIGDKLLPIIVQNVAFFESIDRITWAYMPEGKRHPVSETLDELDTLLDPQLWRRLNRAVIAQASCIEQLTAYSNSRFRAHLKGHAGGPVIVARERVTGVKDWLAGG